MCVCVVQSHADLLPTFDMLTKYNIASRTISAPDSSSMHNMVQFGFLLLFFSLFAGEQYFDSSGFFIFAVFAAPIIINCLVMVVS